MSTARYDQGLASVTNGSATVTGNGATLWAAGNPPNVKPGEDFERIGDGGLTYKVKQVIDDDTLELSAAYAGATGADVSYAVYQSTQNVPGDLTESRTNTGATVDVDPVTITLPAGSSAQVVNTGNTKNALFQFSIPQGADGDAGGGGGDCTAVINGPPIFEDYTAAGPSLVVLNDGKTVYSNAAGSWEHIRGRVARGGSSGKYCFQVTLNYDPTGGEGVAPVANMPDTNVQAGIASETSTVDGPIGDFPADDNGAGLTSQSDLPGARWFDGNSLFGTASFTWFTPGQAILVLVDFDEQKLKATQDGVTLDTAGGFPLPGPGGGSAFPLYPALALEGGGPGASVTVDIYEADFTVPIPAGYVAWSDGETLTGCQEIVDYVEATRFDGAGSEPLPVEFFLDHPASGANIVYDPDDPTQKSLVNPTGFWWTHVRMDTSRRTGKWAFQVRCNFNSDPAYIGAGIANASSDYDAGYSGFSPAGSGYMLHSGAFGWFPGDLSKGGIVWGDIGDLVLILVDLDTHQIGATDGTTTVFNSITGVAVDDWFPAISMSGLDSACTVETDSKFFSLSLPAGFRGWANTSDGDYFLEAQHIVDWVQKYYASVDYSVGSFVQLGDTDYLNSAGPGADPNALTELRYFANPGVPLSLTSGSVKSHWVDCNVGSGSVAPYTVNLPDTPVDGERVSIIYAGGVAATLTINSGAGGNLIYPDRSAPGTTTSASYVLPELWGGQVILTYTTEVPARWMMTELTGVTNP